MKLKHVFSVVPGTLLVITGVTLSLVLSGNLLWGEMEARLHTQQSGEYGLDIECPLMIATEETGAIRTVVTNTLSDEDVKPQVNAFISHEKDARVVSHTLELGPGESQSLEWTVDQADIVFERLILVNILQRPYDDLPSRQGTCSILVFSLFGWNGRETINLLVAAAVGSMLLGAGTLAYVYRPSEDQGKKISQMGSVFLILVMAGLVTALARFWGLTLFFDAAALLTFAIGLTEIFSKS
jgi:hypothetical protein